MATKPFKYETMFPLGPDTTEYYHLTSDYVHTENWGGHEFLIIDRKRLPYLLASVPTTTHSCSVASTTLWWPRFCLTPKLLKTISL